MTRLYDVAKTQVRPNSGLQSSWWRCRVGGQGLSLDEEMTEHLAYESMIWLEWRTGNS
jgi:hypothetical protein